MMIIDRLEQKQIAALCAHKTIPDFSPGDLIRVSIRIVEGSRERLQNFEGVCIARKSGGIGASFTLRKISWGEGVERVFPLYSPRLENITIMRHGRARRAKLYYLRQRSGKSARIARRTTGRGMIQRPRKKPAAESN